jgi:DNA-directed RNA polymerase specialized sigma24 family protein
MDRLAAKMDFIAEPTDPGEVLAVHEALADLEQHDEQLATLVKLRYFAGMSHSEAAAAMGIGRRVADRLWALARAWLHQRLSENQRAD